MVDSCPIHPKTYCRDRCMAAAVFGSKKSKAKKMIIVKLIGGLGNQMFQYAFGKAIAHHHNVKNLYLDLSWFSNTNEDTHRQFELTKLNVFYKDIKEAKLKYRLLEKINLVSAKLPKAGLPIKKTYREKSPITFSPIVGFNKDNLNYFDGYWQSWKYFYSIREILLREFSPKGLHNDDRFLRFKKDLFKSKESVSVHIRRGDYLNHKLHDEICTLAYFTKAFDFIESKVSNPDYFVFSDDMEWCKRNFSGEKITFVDDFDGDESWKNLFLMSYCKHNIISNSSFSWWAAYLNQNPDKKVISPARWFNNFDFPSDIQLPEWKLIA
jgi:hypothetical protein